MNEVRDDAAAKHVPSVAVIGAGAGGVCMGVALRRLGIKDFTIFEQSDGIGGTWWDNAYPGAEVDTPVPLYSFGFHPFDFSRTHVKQPELQRYIENVANRFNLLDNVKFRTGVTRAVWDPSTHSYEVFTTDGAHRHFDVVVSAVGLLNHPNFPDWPGLEKFKGPKFHSARWDFSVDLTGKRVAVVGTGSTSAQMVPAIAPQVDQLYVFQRQPGWLIPKMEREFTAAERARMARSWYRHWVRLQQRWTYEKSRGATIEGHKNNVKAQQACEKYIGTVFKDRPDLAKMVTPDYPFGGKRPVKDSNFYPALLRDNVELVPHAVTELTESEIIDDTGARREIDVLVMCTGFTPANYLATFEMVGREGKTIHEVWNGDPEAYLGLTVAGFPNFYMLYGPNTNMIGMFMHQRQTEFVAGDLKRMMKDGVTAIEVRKSFMDVFNWWLQRRLARSVVDQYPDVHNYGRSPSGRNVIAWGEGMAAYSLLTRSTRRISSATSRLERNGANGAEEAVSVPSG